MVHLRDVQLRGHTLNIDQNQDVQITPFKWLGRAEAAGWEREVWRSLLRLLALEPEPG